MKTPASLLLVPFLLGACLENEEELEIGVDGSVRVALASAGDVDDLCDGYALPLDAAWLATSDDTRRWLVELGPDTGSAFVRQRAGELAWPAEPGQGPRASLAVERRLASVEELPRWYAPADDPYRTAHLERETSLAIRELGEKRVYVFERVFHGFHEVDLDLGARLRLSEDVEKKLEAREPLTNEEKADVVERVVSAYEGLAVGLARAALLGLYTRGASELPVGAHAAVLEEVRAAARATVTPRRLRALLELLQDEGAERDEGAGRALDELESEWRAALRGALAAALERAALPAESQNAVLYALEWQFTAGDQADDLGDESFALSVTLPGTIVGGNFTECDGARARWTFEGKELKEHDVVLRAISVLDGTAPRAGNPK